MWSAEVDLPVEGVLPELRRALTGEGSAILVAPPGSGKTTRVPPALLSEPWLEGRRIVVLEPRRIATRAAAARMAFLLGEETGETVGYVTRDERRVSRRTRVEVVTEGVLTRRIQRDPTLEGVGLVVFDEVHERNLQTDLGLAFTLESRRQVRPDLRVLAMSATPDAAALADLLGGGTAAPVVECTVEPFPVEVRWRPQPRTGRLERHVATVVREALQADAGDVLVFLPGAGEIGRVGDLLSDGGVQVRPLHGGLSPEDQDAALRPGGGRKVVLATDIAETSLTVEGVRVVVDGGLARAPRFDAGTGMTRLRTVPISKASAEQRAGRAGRLGPGVVYRCWSKLEHAARRPHTEAEVGQVDLAGMALELAAWGAPEPSALPLPDQPPARSMEEARALLRMLGAVDDSGRITPSGRAMSELPLHPRLARMVVDAGTEAGLACLLAALVDERDVLRGHPDRIPADIGTRVALLVGGRDHPAASRRAVERVRRTAADLARRVGTRLPDADGEGAGRLLLLAFPDRLAVRRGSPGRFQLRRGSTTWVPREDPLGLEAFLVAAELDGRRKDARIRLAAPLRPDEVAEAFGHEVTEQLDLRWEGDRLVERRERRLGAAVLDTSDRRPHPSHRVTAALVERVRAGGPAELSWTEQARSLVERVGFLHRRLGPPWPDWTVERLTEEVERWLVPALDAPTGLDDLRSVDLAGLLRRLLPHHLTGDLDRLAPTHLRLATGRRVRLDYSGEVPVLAVQVQELFGTTRTPEVAGERVLLHLLSPAGRPLQITQDLEGFWGGSWKDVRREMAGRYPKHAWPEHPA